ncbi:hypothetical protein B0H12DRAFT_156819 [Mycena haematopus]|nr:hypothetical protein B0H12DRAFT_156819 [Mycena haematopus]
MYGISLILIIKELLGGHQKICSAISQWQFLEPRFPWTPCVADVDEITRRADGLFVFAATAVRYIRAGSAKLNPQESLDFLLGGAVLVDLDELYFRIINEALQVPGKIDLLAQKFYTNSLTILSTILVLLEPMALKDLTAFLAWMRIVSEMCSLL